jgi:hypothetical protein
MRVARCQFSNLFVTFPDQNKSKRAKAPAGRDAEKLQATMA